MTLQPGDLLDGYTISKVIAQGGAGVVYLAQDASLDRHVAIKVLRLGSRSAKARERFSREARALARLRHPHIVAVHSAGLHDDQPYLVMDHVRGSSLQHVLDQQGHYTPHEALRLTLQVLSALEYAHGHGVLHRDLKPANVLLDHDHRALLADFGLVKDLAGGDATLTATGRTLGTPGYWPPEQARGDGANVTAAADVYGLGALLYALLTGRPPCGGNSLSEVLIATLETVPDPPSKTNQWVGSALDRVCAVALAKAPADRPSLGELRQLLETAHTPAAKPVETRPSRTGSGTVHVLLGVALLALTGLALGWLGHELTAWRGAHARIDSAQQRLKTASADLEALEQERTRARGSIAVLRSRRSEEQQRLAELSAPPSPSAKHDALKDELVVIIRQQWQSKQEFLSSLLEEWPLSDQHRQTAREAIQLARAARQREDLEEAQRQLRVAERSNPKDPELHLVQGHLDLDRGDAKAGRSAFERAKFVEAPSAPLEELRERLTQLEAEAEED